LETALAERVALSLWRLRRVACYETAVTAIGIEEVPEDIQRQSGDPFAKLGSSKPLPVQLAEAEVDLEKLRGEMAAWEGADRLLAQLHGLSDDAEVNGEDAGNVVQQLRETAEEHYECSSLPDPGDDDWLIELGVPQDEVRDAYEWSGWNAGMVRLARDQMARAAYVSGDKLLARAIDDRRRSAASTREREKDFEKTVKALRRRIRTQEERQRQRRMLPDDDTLNKVTRYEAHLSRQMLQALR
jgi:hypothetical protein